MNDRIHACLDGEIPADELSRAELLQMAHLQQLIDAAARPLRTAALPDLSERVMRAIAETRPAPSWRDRIASLGRQAFAWLWQPRPLRLHLRPAYALAGAMAFALVMLQPPLLPLSNDGSIASRQEDSPGIPAMYVQFRLEASGASHVALAGSFTEWQPRYSLTELTPGVWTALVPLDPGVHDYAFVVDGERWVADPHAPQIMDDFGGANSRLALLVPGGDV